MTQTSFQVTSSAVSDRGLSEKRPQNEDSYIELPEHGLFAVADGVGGAQAGDVASQMAMEILGEAFANLRDGGDVEELMKVAISRANEAIYQMSHDLPSLSTMATTIVGLHIAENIATIGHAGDSRLYRLDSRGQLFRETQDHSVVEEEVRAGRMTAEQAEHHPSKNVISRALGAERAVEVDMKTIMFEPDTTFLLCSDGVTRHIPDTEIRELLAASQPLPQICGQIKDICYSRGAEDNLTAVIIRIEGSEGGQQSDFEDNTVASPRPAITGNAVFVGNLQEEADEIPTQNLQMPVLDATDQNYQNDSQISIPASVANVDSGAVDSSNQLSIAGNQSDSHRQLEDEKDVAAYEENKSGVFGKLLSGLLFLIVGGCLGAAGIYYWLQSQPNREVPAITQVQTPNIPFSAFENNRRNVDRNPAQYITASGTTADDAEDYYLLGRALMLTGKYVEAGDAFRSAKERLPMTAVDDRQMLANEIAIGLATIDNPFSRKILEAERTSPPNTNANTSANIAPFNRTN